MCRRKDLHNCCLLVFALGLLVGRCVNSWFICGALVAVCFLVPLVRRR